MYRSNILCVPTLLLKLAVGALALTLLLVFRSDKIVLGFLVGFEWLASTLLLYPIVFKRRRLLWCYVQWVIEVGATAVFLEWLGSILFSNFRSSSLLERQLQLALLVLATVSKLLAGVTIDTLCSQNEITAPDKPPVASELPPLLETLNMVPPFSTGLLNTQYSFQSKSELSALSQFSDTASQLIGNPINNQLLMQPYQKTNSQFVVTTPTFESKFQTQDTEARIHMLNIPELSDSPMLVSDQSSFEPDFNINKILSASYGKANLDTIKSLQNDLPPMQIECKKNGNDLDTSSHDDLFYESLHREIIDNTKVKHQVSAPNLNFPNNSIKTHSVRHSWSHSHLNLKMKTNISNHNRSSSHSPIKKLSRTFKDSISISSSSNNLNNNHNRNHSSNNFITDDDNNSQSNFELNMDLVKSIQRSPKKKTSIRSLNHNKFPSISEPLWFNPSMIPKNSESDEKNRIVSSNSIPDGYYSLYDREKWQAIKNRS